jgi:Trypsin-like peptidase domain
MAEPDYMEIKARAAPRLLALPGVHAVGVGAKQVDGKRTEDVAIAVFVEHKRPLADVPADERIPDEIEGVKTDVIEMPVPQTIQLPPGQLFGAKREDARKYRPIRGGTQCEREGQGRGTFGCMFTMPSDPKTVIAATCHHVIYTNCSDKANKEHVGQADGETSSSGCCQDIVGKVLAAVCDEEVDVALIKLDGGEEWLAEVQEVGPVGSTHFVEPAEANPPNTYPVQKRGRTTSRTGGVISHTGTEGTVTKPVGVVQRTYKNGMLIEPKTDEEHPTTGVDFALPGDSGSALLNETGQVVGMVFAANFATATKNGTAFAFPIKDLIDKFAEKLPAPERLEIRVATAVNAGEVHTVAMSADEQQAQAPITSAEAMRLERELRTTEQGAWYAELYHRHGQELSHLVHSNRRVTVAWHRSGAAELMQSLIRAFSRPETRIPEEIQGRPIRACLEELAAAIKRSGSAALDADARRVLPTLPDIAGLSQSEIVEQLKGSAPAAAAGSA